MGEPREIRWSWESKDNDTRVGYMAMEGRMSIAELIEHMRDVAPGVDPADVRVNWATVVWSRPATGEELAQRRRAQERHDARHEEWERKTLARLTEKYRPTSVTVHGPGAWNEPVEGCTYELDWGAE
jgi:hypothetical protein